MADEGKIVKQTAQHLLESLGFTETEIGVEKEKTEGEEEVVINIKIEASPEDTGMLIGFHGETLAALQLIVSQMVYKKLGSWRRVIVNIGDYREKREVALREMATNAASRAKLTGSPVMLPYLGSNERRLIHLALSEDPDVETTSQGTGRGRRLSVSLKRQEKVDSQEHE